ncbi:MAG TPA: peptidyl-alpha-hydroxyglycine alpha-amidating lyase family protein [Bryobacteraceae bacterium]|jgi:DNA-binding beta-propeller fold protein YncE|nr:peptidyl-alpha-hydroxyglycine alpha-amidating lyase family protein [Bryobacteraceae bacterium]
MWKIPVVASLPAVLAVLAAAGGAPAALPGEWTSAGFLKLPSSAEVGPMSAVAVDRAHGFIYVLHRGGTPLLQFDAKGKYLNGWGHGEFKVPHGLRVDSAGNLWITDNGLHTVRKFSPGGKVLATVTEANGKLKSPDDLVIASNGSLYIADTGNGRIVHLTADAKFLSQFGEKGKGPGQFTTAHGLAIDRQDNIYVADRGNNRVEKFTPSGKFVAEFHGFGNPFGLLAWRNEVFVSEGDQHKIIELGPKGEIVRTWGSPDLLQLPHLMDYSQDGTLYIAEVNGKRVQMFRFAQ